MSELPGFRRRSPDSPPSRASVRYWEVLGAPLAPPPSSSLQLTTPEASAVSAPPFALPVQLKPGNVRVPVLLKVKRVTVFVSILKA